VLITRSNTTCRSSTIVFHYTLQHVLVVQISHHQVGVEYTKINIKGEIISSLLRNTQREDNTQ